MKVIYIFYFIHKQDKLNIEKKIFLSIFIHKEKI